MCERRAKFNQQGIVSIVVTIILMLVITLITLAFSRISRREQRNALDRQLSTQAFYAAESGVNDARNVLSEWFSAADARLNSDYLDDCDQFALATQALPAATNPVDAVSSVLPGSGAASYTCMFVDPSPPELVYSLSESQHIFPIKDKGGGAIQDIDIFWDDSSNPANWAGCPDHTGGNNNPPILSNCTAPLVKIEIVSASSLNVSKAFYVYPNATNSDTIDFGADNTGRKVRGVCNGPPTDPHKCKFSITGLGGIEYFIRIRPIYRSAAFTIMAYNGGTQLELVGAQALIDVTGKATDVLRRIQVRVKANDIVGTAPIYGLHGTDKVCKKFSIDGSTASDDGPCKDPASPSWPD